MPNWSSNRLYVKGNPEKVKEFTDTLGGKDSNDEDAEFSFHQTVPMPENCFKGNLPFDYSGPNWRDWSCQNWGTKWDACDVDCDAEGIKQFVENACSKELEETVIDIGFETAWCPPLPWMEKASEKFPDLTFEIAFSECGMNYYGTATAINGDVEENYVEGCTFSEEDESYYPDGEYGEFLSEHKIHAGG